MRRRPGTTIANEASCLTDADDGYWACMDDAELPGLKDLLRID
jgi:hypothetical protein